MSGAVSVRVALASGDVFFVEGELLQVVHRIEEGERHGRFVYLGSRLVAPGQVCQLQAVREVPGYEIVERLED